MNTKISKKLVIPFVSTVMGFALIGGIGGSFAWYQYNSRATASFIGTSVANTGSLLISNTGVSTEFGRNVYPYSTNKKQLHPVTFGEIGATAVPGTAYVQPEPGKGPYSEWTVATNGSEYVQFDVYLKAIQADANETSGYKQVSKPVYLSDIHLEDVTANHTASEALRVHLAVEGGSTFLISKNAVTNLALYGGLDLDSDGQKDKNGNYVFDSGYDTETVYGKEGDKQTTIGVDTIKAVRDANGDFPSAATKICDTKADANVKITVTVWLEGWHQYGEGTATSAIWNPAKTGFTDVNVGLTFDVGKNAFNA